MSDPLHLLKRPRRAASSAEVLDSVRPSKDDDAPLFMWNLAQHMQGLPSHEHQGAQGWWCEHPLLMRELITFLAEQPIHAGIKESSWRHFRRAVAVQLNLCNRCAANYYGALEEWQMNLKRRELALRRIRSLITWDLERLHPRLLRGTMITTTSSVASNEHRIRDCRGAFFQCLQSFRLCLDPTIATTLGDLFKTNILNHDTGHLRPFFEHCGSMPSGLVALCFHPLTKAREWAQNVYERMESSLGADMTTIEYIILKVARRLSHSSVDEMMQNRLSFTTNTFASWSGLHFFISKMSCRTLQNLGETFKRGELLEIFAEGLDVSKDELVEMSCLCIIQMLDALEFDKLFVLKRMSLEGLLDLIFQSFNNRSRRYSAKMKLLLVIAPVLARARQGLGAAQLSRLFRKCFDFLFDASRPGTNLTFWWRRPLAGEGIRTELEKEQKNVARTCADLLRWHYSVCSPNLPLHDEDKLALFILDTLQENPEKAWAWDLLRTVLLADTLNVARRLCSPEAVNEAAKAFFSERPENASIGLEQEEVLCSIVQPPSARIERSGWVDPLWNQFRDGNHLTETQKYSAFILEAKLLFDLHGIIGMIETSHLTKRHCQSPQNGGERLFALRPSQDENFVVSQARNRFTEIKTTVRKRLLEAFQRDRSEKLWKHMLYHAAHLLASAEDDVAIKALDLMLSAKGKEQVSPGSDDFEQLWKNDEDELRDIAIGCVSTMNTLCRLPHSVSMHSFVSTFRLYVVLLKLDSVAMTDERTCQLILKVIQIFMENWKRYNTLVKAAEFQDAYRSFLVNLRDVSDAMFSLEKTSHRDVNEEEYGALWLAALKSIFTMHEVDDAKLRSLWVRLICKLKPHWSNVEELRGLVSEIIMSHTLSKNKLKLKQCQKIAANVSGMIEVNNDLEMWSKEGTEG